jgi:hypothetical protein
LPQADRGDKASEPQNIEQGTPNGEGTNAYSPLSYSPLTYSPFATLALAGASPRGKKFLKIVPNSSKVVLKFLQECVQILASGACYHAG